MAALMETGTFQEHVVEVTECRRPPAPAPPSTSFHRWRELTLHWSASQQNTSKFLIFRGHSLVALLWFTRSSEGLGWIKLNPFCPLFAQIKNIWWLNNVTVTHIITRSLRSSQKFHWLGLLRSKRNEFFSDLRLAIFSGNTFLVHFQLDFLCSWLYLMNVCPVRRSFWQVSFHNCPLISSILLPVTTCYIGDGVFMGFCQMGPKVQYWSPLTWAPCPICCF